VPQADNVSAYLRCRCGGPETRGDQKQHCNKGSQMHTMHAGTRKQLHWQAGTRVCVRARARVLACVCVCELQSGAHHT
jgi:hypothetical protein